VEAAGVGLELVTPQAVYRLGAPTERGPDADVTFERDARVLASFKTLEELRPDAASEVRALTADGLEIWMATGDSEPRARAVAASCDIPEVRVLAAQSPEQKAALIQQVDRGDTLMIGDGVNDGPAVQAAHCSGTPAAGRAFLASRADFYLLSSGLGPVRTGLAAAHALRRTLRRNLGWRLRPLHTNAVIFAFVGNMMFAGVYYSTQRLTEGAHGVGPAGNVHFWGWQRSSWRRRSRCPSASRRRRSTPSSSGRSTSPSRWSGSSSRSTSSGRWRSATRSTSTSRSGSTSRPSSPSRCCTSSTASRCPVSLTSRATRCSGVQDALVQWWYGHNAVAFFLTTPILGIMYYFLPKAAERPVYSYRLSIVHFWALVFIYIWAGPHHLLYTALPDWAQSLGMVFSVMLWAPSWGGMLNGLLTLRGAWDKLRTDPVLKFFAAGVTFYGMATFEGPLLSIKSVSALAHYTDWIIGHVHGARSAGTASWPPACSTGWCRALRHQALLEEGRRLALLARHGRHPALHGLDVGLGVTQGLMWRATNARRVA
jgi:phosphoglycolate phosphatase-like HAD superfamily hydrolase